MTRNERIAEAKKKLVELKPAYDAYKDAETELRRAEASFDVGELVHVEELCRRGCCVEAEYDGLIERQNTNETYVIREANGLLHDYVSQSHMTRKR